MITVDHPRMMARYNAWQNRSLYAAADRLSDDQRHEDRGAFFGSIYGTLSHLYWADTIWMARFTGGEKPTLTLKETVNFEAGWPALQEERVALDRRILVWADALSPEWLGGDLSWFSGALQRDVARPRSELLVHFFNHQTHHRGQVHAMLTSFGARPEDTDLPFMPDEI